MDTDRAPFPKGQDQTIRQLLERIERASRIGPFEASPTRTLQINEWARTAITICDRLTSNESAWIVKYHEAKSLGFSDADAEVHADHEVARRG